MPITYSLNREHDLVVTRFTGRPGDDEFLELYDRLLHDPDYRLGTNELADVREADRLDVTAEGLRKIDEMHRRRYAGSDAGFRTAILTARDQPFGVARMYQAFSEEGPEHVLVSRSPEEALAWLGLAPDALKGAI